MATQSISNPKQLVKSLISIFPSSFERGLRKFWHGIRDKIELINAYRYDHQQYSRHSGLFLNHTEGALEAIILKAYHRIEKGMALGEPRPGFGKDAVLTVLESVEEYISRYKPTLNTARAIRTLEEYVTFNKNLNVDMNWLEIRLAQLKAKQTFFSSEGGTQLISRSDVITQSSIDLRSFFSSRFSVRQFSKVPVDDDLIRQAVEMALKTPSVCNRQSGCAYVFSSPQKKAELLALQNGNRGFGDQADKLFVVTSRMDTFLSVEERYQHWIDGGLFAMSLIYALHSLGLGSCCLNWSVQPEADRKLKESAGIPANHAVIMLIAVGHIPENFRVAQSPRRALGEVLKFM